MNADIINLFGRFHLSQTCEPPVSVHLLLSYSLVFQTTILNFWRKVIKNTLRIQENKMEIIRGTQRNRQMNGAPVNPCVCWGNKNRDKPLEEYGALPWCHASALGL